MKIIVAGGTGFLGRKIVSSLADKGHNVCVLTRNLNKHKNSFSNNVNVIDWSTINPSFFQKICFQPFHLLTLYLRLLWVCTFYTELQLRRDYLY